MDLDLNFSPLAPLALQYPRSFDEVLNVFQWSHPEHGLQCAYELLDTRSGDVELQIAGLFHDIAHRVEGSTEATHGILGEQILAPLFGDRVGALVRLHVPAKRYLVTTRPEYAAVLAGDGTQTLALQGGLMTKQECAEFLSERFSADAIVLRFADDQAKEPGRYTPSLVFWEPIARRLHEKNLAAQAACNARATAEQ